MSSDADRRQASSDSALSAVDVARIAELARLRLAPAEIDRYAAQLGTILHYIQQLDELDTDNVEPLAHAAELTNVFRADQVVPSLTREDALANAPSRDTECFRVPAVLGESDP